MRISHILSAALVTSVIAIGCARKNEVILPAERAIGGIGGKATLKITPRHHLQNIEGATVYVKYDTLGWVTTFDDSAVVSMENGKPVATFDSLMRGNYYLYAKGVTAQDSFLDGGAPFTIIDSLEATYDLYLDVSLQREK